MTGMFKILADAELIVAGDEYALDADTWMSVPQTAIGLRVQQAVNRAILPADVRLGVRRRIDKTPSAPRRRLPDERPAITHKFTVGGYEVYVTVGLYSDGMPGEVFLLTAKEGSTVRGLLDTIGILLSLALQSGIPLEKLCEKLRHMRFEPQGIAIGRADITMATSICDYIAHWMSLRFLPAESTEPIDEKNRLLDDIESVVSLNAPDGQPEYPSVCIEEAICEAVQRERERCAKIVEEHGGTASEQIARHIRGNK